MDEAGRRGGLCREEGQDGAAPGTCSHAPSHATCRVWATSELLLTSQKGVLALSPMSR